MISVVTRAARLWLAHWPALLAWFLGGTIVHYLVLRLASWVGARSAAGGILLLPLAALALLVAYVAMFLVLRDGMPRLRAATAEQAAADLDSGGASAAPRATFLDSLLAGILPFVAFYAAWGYIREDVVSYINGAFAWQFGLGLEAVVSGGSFDTDGTIDDLGFTPLTIALLVIAFAGRWAIKRYGERVRGGAGRGLKLVAVYLETLWVYLAAYLVGDILTFINTWVQTRQGTLWLTELRGALTGWLEPVGVLWDGVEWLIGEVGGLVLLPLAWLAIAGVIYGRAVSASAPQLDSVLSRRAALSAARRRYEAVPQRIRRRLKDFWGTFAGRFRPITSAFSLMWSAGPALIGGYVLLFTLVTFGEQWLLVGASRALGPHDDAGFWGAMSAALVMLVSFVVEPVRISAIAASYDTVLGAAADKKAVEVEVEAEVEAERESADSEAQIEQTGVGAGDGDVETQLVGEGGQPALGDDAR